MFFRTNRATCEDWLNRLRPAIINICLKAGLPGAAMWHATALLRNGRSPSPSLSRDLDSVVCDVAEAMIRLKSSMGLAGLIGWARSHAPVHERWLAGAILHASGNCEAASAVSNLY
jgi:PI-3-kinase-related kinase SMG-1